MSCDPYQGPKRGLSHWSMVYWTAHIDCCVTSGNRLIHVTEHSVIWCMLKVLLKLKLPCILESNPHPNLIRASFCRFLKRKKKKLVRGSNPQLSFNRPLPTRQTDWIILDVTNALTVIRLTCRVWSGHLTASGTNAPHLIRRWHSVGGR